MPRILIFLIILTYLFFPSPQVFAQDGRSFITIVNPVRISTYTQDPALSLKKEYEEIRKKDLPATWLLTYDAIANKSLFEVFSLMDERQEFGIFLEATEKFSNNSGIPYNKTNSWHHATSVFLSGYRQEDRKKLIDTVFIEFKERFGYYPKSVGGWWVDAFSLSYMQEKYDISGVLGISDQFDLDGYQVWGTPFSIPFYPSKIHAGIPGDSSNKLDVVTFRWAARDPLNGYISPSQKQASLYSVQDYSQVGASDEYFEKLVDLYSVKSEYNEFAHLTVGLEADYSPDTYEAIFAKRLSSVKKFEEQGVSVLTMEEFSDWYKKEFPKTSPPHFIETDDLLGESKKVVWYQSSFYRMGLMYDYSSKKIQIIDLRPYLNNFQEPFYTSHNKQFNLSINLPFVIDYMNDRDSVQEIDVGNLESISREGSDINLKFEKGSIVFRAEEIVSGGISIPEIKKRQFDTPPEGMVFSDFSFNVPFAIKSRISKFYSLLILVTLALGIVIFKKRKLVAKYYPVTLIIVIISVSSYFLVKANTKYYVSQTEVDGLSVLSRLPKGRVLVYDKDCLRCSFATSFKPAAAGGIKSYVERLSGQETLADFSFAIARTSQDAREILKDRDVYYVYLVKYEDYIEHLPYLPQDLGLSKVYSNANIEIWKVD